MDESIKKSKEQLCELIKKSIKEREIKHREICEKTGKVQSWVSKVVNGKVDNVSYDAIFDFAKQLGFEFNIEIKSPTIFNKNVAGFTEDKTNIDI